MLQAAQPFIFRCYTMVGRLIHQKQAQQYQEVEVLPLNPGESVKYSFGGRLYRTSDTISRF
jgi:hypothetical protein